eukprot:18909-Heterococcus_DN1.PRE.3
MLQITAVQAARDQPLARYQQLTELIAACSACNACTAMQWILAFEPFAGADAPRNRLTQQGVGFSGVIFTMAVLETSRSSEPYRSVMGFFQVPTSLSESASFELCSSGNSGSGHVMMSEISFIAHLSGAIVGVLHASGMTNFFMPSSALLRDMETWPGICWVVASCPNYKPAPQQSAAADSANSRPLTLRSMAQVNVQAAMHYRLTCRSSAAYKRCTASLRAHCVCVSHQVMHCYDLHAFLRCVIRRSGRCEVRCCSSVVGSVSSAANLWAVQSSTNSNSSSTSSSSQWQRAE